MKSSNPKRSNLLQHSFIVYIILFLLFIILVDEQNMKEAYFKNRLGFYQAFKNPLDGIVVFDMVYKENPNNVTTVIRLGILYLKAKRFDKAEEFFNKALMLDKNNEAALHFLKAMNKR